MIVKAFHAFLSKSQAQKFFILFAMVTGFCIAAEYGITRPASNALFLTICSSEMLPWVWLATVPLNLLCVLLYNKFLPKMGPLRMFLIFSFSVMALQLITPFLLAVFPPFIFFHYAWKDIYILFMFKELWSMVHSTIRSDEAKYIYGPIFAAGTIGAIFGNFISGFFARDLGSENLFFITIPLYLILSYSYKRAFALSSVEPEKIQEDSFRKGFSLIFQNRLLVTILLLVIFMQASIALMEYQFNAHLELNILDKDLRTEYWGKTIGIMNLLSAFFQVVGSFLLLHVFGVKRTHLLIPMMLLMSALSSWVIAPFASLTLGLIFIKSLDFSLFGVAREMLYIPLSPDEKYRAKAVIDVFAYRTSKALVSLAVLSLQFLIGMKILKTLHYTSLFFFVLWFLLAFFLLKSEKKKISKNPILS